MVFLVLLIIALASFLLWRLSQEKYLEQRNVAFRTSTAVTSTVFIIAVLLTLVQFAYYY